MRKVIAVAAGIAWMVLPSSISAGETVIPEQSPFEIADMSGLRGSVPHDASLAALIERDRARTRGVNLPAGPKPSTSIAPLSLELPKGVDHTLTGSNLPAGIDPMITGTNR